MSINFDSETQIFHLQAGRTSYVMRLVNGLYLTHVHWGSRIRGTGLDKPMPRPVKSFSPMVERKPFLSLDTLPQELPGYGTSDFRAPAFQAQFADGTTTNELVYESHRIYAGKPKLAGLPATYVEDDGEADSLDIVLRDPLTGLKAVLTYTAFRNHDAVARSVRFENDGDAPIRLLRALSLGLDLPRADYDMLHLAGSWIRERHIERRPLVPGISAIESRRGASSHTTNPFLALLGKGANEDHGEVFGFSLVYSGSFLAQAEVDQFATTRVLIGINPFDFQWLLEPGQSFQTPEAVLVYSAAGLGGMSRTYHRLYRSRLCRGEHRDRVRPVLVNNWEATYFNFTADKIEQIAAAGQELGIELFVLDDGWFGKRDNDHSSLGDWFVDRNKLPGGLEDLVERVNHKGLQFGLWFEPEMISPDSELYRAHPDWCLHVPGRRRTEARQQLVLDFSRADVRDYIVKAVSDILASCPIRYVKWDMNRNMTEIGSALLPPERQRETAHRYMLGLYEVLERITSAFPHILFESCSGGGGRFDPGMLYYMPQTWTSDDSDAIERLKIQYGTSLVYPASTMGAHVSAVPNHQVRRLTPLTTRGVVAMSGSFGYELDLTKFTSEEQELVKQQVALYKEIRPIVQFGDMYRLLNPFEGNETAWMFISEDRSDVVVVWVRTMAVPHPPISSLRLKGLDPDADYRVSEGGFLREDGPLYGGDELMQVGLYLPDLKGDYQGVMYRLTRV